MYINARNTFLALTVSILPLVTAVPALAQETLTVGVVSDPVTLDPTAMASFFEVSVQYNIHEPLLHSTPELNVEPGLASFEQVDATTYNFTLREGLTFHDGTPLNAEAVKANFDYVLNPDNGSPRLGELGPVSSVEVTGDLTFTITLETPFAPLLQALTNRAGMMVSPTARAELGDDFAAQAVGAGPYRVVQWEKNSQLVLEAFPGYWRGEPEIDTVIFQPIADEAVRMTNLRSGAVQLVDTVPPQSVAQIETDTSIAVKQTPGVGFNAFSFGTTKAPFDNVLVRQAFQRSIDQQAILQAVYFGYGNIAYGAIPPSHQWVYDPEFKPYEYDIEAAKALLAEAGVSTPIDVSVVVTNTPAQVRTAEIMQALANQAGFNVTINQIDSSSLITVLREGDFDLAASPWSGRADPDANMFNYFTIGGSNNFAGYESEAVDGLLRQARSETDQSVRADLYREIETQIAEDAPLLFISHPVTIQASANSLDWQQWPDGAFRLQFANFK
jgi:peptide/nickel transport system substrate-binding protein